MKPQYQNWIDSYLKSLGKETPYGECGNATQAMTLVFPELRLAKGYVYDMAWGERTHWWCVTPEGEVVDPTVSQFPSFLGGYIELKEGEDPIPSGVCADCGDTVYDGEYFCSDECAKATEAYLNSKPFLK